MKYLELDSNIEKWADNKDLIKEENTFPQYAKFMEEANEILIAMNKKEQLKIKANKLNVNDAKQMELLRTMVSDVNYELKDALGDTLVTLIILSKQYGLNLIECLEQAYNEIKGRTGKTVNGNFIKD